MEIEIKNLTKKYGNTLALSDLSLKVGTGMFGLLGPNGAGKTTLMRIMATLLPPTTGTVIVDGIDVCKNPQGIREILGYLPQNFAGYGNLSVYEYLDYMALLKRLPSSSRKDRVLEVIDQVNLTNKLKQRVRSLSGGMKRRLGIAQAILNDPKLLIVDEPTAGLDPEERVCFRNLLAQFSQDRIVLLSTHIVPDVAGSCQQIAIVKQGQLLLHCSPGQLVAKAQGKIWEFSVESNQTPFATDNYTVIDSMIQGSRITLRVAASKPPADNAVTVEPTMEDAYLCLMREVS